VFTARYGLIIYMFIIEVCTLFKILMIAATQVSEPHTGTGIIIKHVVIKA
jgi:hypothetical protein